MLLWGTERVQALHRGGWMKGTNGRKRVLGTPPQSPKSPHASNELVSTTSTAENIQNGQGRPFAWLPLVAIAFCVAAHTVALSSLVTYMGICVQQLLELPSVNTAGEHVVVVFLRVLFLS